MSVAMILLGLLYAAGLALPLWLHSVGLLTWFWALGADGAVLLLFGAQYASLDRAALRASGARFVDREQAPRLHDAVDRLCVLAEVPKPRLAVIDSVVPDAFATGRVPSRSTIAVTRGLVAKLEPAEIEAVLAHELAHVANRDGAVMTIASFPALSLREALAGAPLRAWIFGFPFLLLGCLAYVVSTGLMLTVSRCREYSADRGSAVITGTPEQLMSALQKIAGAMPQIPDDDLRGVAAMSAFFIIPTKLRSLTHPPLARRLERLAQIARELGKPDYPAGPAVTVDGARTGNLTVGIATFVAVFAVVLLLGIVLR